MASAARVAAASANLSTLLCSLSALPRGPLRVAQAHSSSRPDSSPTARNQCRASPFQWRRGGTRDRGEGGRKGGERVEGVGERSEPVPGPPAGRGWRSTNCWVPPSGPHSLHPTSPAAPGAAPPADGELGEKGGGEMEVSFGSYCLPPREGGRMCVGGTLACGTCCRGKRTAFRLPALQSKKPRVCIAPFGSPLAALLRFPSS